MSYEEEATKLKDDFLRELFEFFDTHKEYKGKGNPFLKEEMEIRNRFSANLKALQNKYGIKN